MKLRTYLILLVVAAVLPVVIFASVMIYTLGRHEQAAAERSLVNSVRALSLAVDVELEGRIRVLQALATSKHLRRGELKEFYAEATAVMKSQERWSTLELFDASGYQILNIILPYGSRPPSGPAADPKVKEALDLARPTVSDLFISRALGVPRIAANVPVVRDGKVQFVVTSNASPAFLTRLLAQQNIPSEWLATIIDRNKIIIARTHDFEKFLGKPASPSFIAKSKEAKEITWLGITLEGAEVYAATSRSDLSGWTVALAVPVSTLETPAQHLLMITSGGGFAVLLLGVALATFSGRPIATSITSLSNTAKALVGQDPAASGGGQQIAEVRQVARAIQEAALRREQGEKALWESENMFRSAFEHAPFGMCLVSPEGRFLRVNGSLCQMLGYSESELLAMTFVEVTHPDDVATSNEWVRQLLTDETTSFDLEKRYLHKAGNVVWGRVRAFLLRNTDDSPHFFITHIQDITERKRAEEALRKSEASLAASQRQAKVGNWDLDLATLTGPWSAEMFRLFRRDPAQGVPPLAEFLEGVHPEDRPALEQMHRRSVAEGGTASSEFRSHPSQGETRWFHAILEAIKNADSRVSRLAGTVQDITERKRAEETLRNVSRQLLRSQDEERRRIARELHDSSAQQMAAATMMIDRISRSQNQNPEETRKTLSEIRNLIDQSQKEIRTLSYLLHPPLLDEMGLLPALRSYVDGFNKRSGITVALDLPPQIENISSEVALVLFRVMQEALSNIHRHSGSSTANVRLSTSDSSNLVLEVSDHGRGISPAMDRNSLVADSGLGVGIAGMRERLAQLGGRLQIESSGRGTTVKAILPLGVESL